MTELTRSTRKNPTPSHQSRRFDLRNSVLILILLFPVYAWFYQGEGDGQKAHYFTTRAIVERGSFRIDAYEYSTGDVSFYGDAVYSNKPFGLPVMGAIVYAPIHWFERIAGISEADPEVRRVNEYLVGLWCSALPGALVAVVLYQIFRRRGVDAHTAVLLAVAFGYGSLLMPYAGALSVHNLNALCVILPWALLTSAPASRSRELLAGAVVGLGITTNYLMAPMAGLFGLFLLWERRGLWPVVRFAIGPAVALATLAIFAAVNFGSPLATSNTYQAPAMSEEGKLFGMMGWPDWRMIYWLTIHPFRGVFYYCPVLLIGLAGLLMQWRTLLQPRQLVPLLTILYFFLANASFNGWTGGWFAGPRYLIPAMPMLFLFAPPAYARYRVLSWIVIIISTFNMLAIASVRVVFPAPSFGPPPPLSDSFSNPVAECYRRWTFNQVARQIGSFNVGMKMGLHGTASLIPIALYIAASTLWLVFRDHLRPRAEQ